LKEYRINENVRTRLKHPLGHLILGSPEHTMSVLAEAIAREKPPKICVVGDFTALKTIEYNIPVDLYVIDNQVMRHPFNVPLPERVKVYRSCNPPGRITAESWDLIKRITDEDTRSLLIIEGEEDLLTLPVIKFAPNDAFVAYGQPHVGLVLVKVTAEKRKEIDAIIDLMEQ
jgi:uncharacterized protein (UPF0218 family)